MVTILRYNMHFKKLQERVTMMRTHNRASLQFYKDPISRLTPATVKTLLCASIK